jgi:predicted metal-dependent peptidase
MKQDIETKLSAARTRLILDKPFLGALVLRLPVVEADPKWCKTTATDARSFYYNPEYIDALNAGQVEFVLAHEALHCALAHFARRGHRNKRRWDLACDFAINPLLLMDGLTPPPDAMYIPEYDGMTAEEIYPLIDENTDAESMDQHMYDGEQTSSASNNQPADELQGESQSGSQGRSQGRPNDKGSKQGAAQPAPLTPDEREKLSLQWRQRLAGAAQQAMQAGKLKGALARLVDDLIQPQLPWQALLARYMTAIARDDFTYMRPSRREGAAILPSLRSSQVDVVVVLDTSGSVSDEEIQEFLSEIDALKGQVRARITLLACDTEIAQEGPWIFEAWEELRYPKQLKGGGGTNFVPAFSWVNSQDMAPDLVVYFTDAQGTFPNQEPVYPVVWLVKGNAEVPWGQRIQLN